MRYIFLAAILFIGMLYAQTFQLNTPEGSITMTISGVQSDGNTTSGNIIDQIAKKLEQMENELHIKLSKLDQKRAENLMNEIYALLALLPTNQTVNVKQSVSSSSSTTAGNNININISGLESANKPDKIERPVKVKEEPKSEPVAEKSARKAIPDNEFNNLLEAINKESFSDGKIRVLKTAVKNYRFNCSQIVRLLGAYTYSSDKLQALRLAYPEVIDPQNNYKILDAFTFESDKEEAEEIINK